VPSWISIAGFLGVVLAYVIALQWIGRAWLSERWSARRAAVAAGALIILLVVLPASISADRDGNWIDLLVLVFLASVIISSNLTIWTYAERHGVRDELRRLFARKPPRSLH
jgi:hypothetical protein